MKTYILSFIFLQTEVLLKTNNSNILVSLEKLVHTVEDLFIFLVLVKTILLKGTLEIISSSSLILRMVKMKVEDILLLTSCRVCLLASSLVFFPYTKWNRNGLLNNKY